MKFKSNIETQAGIEDSSASAGTAGQLLSSLGPVAGVDGVEWVDQSTIVASAATLVEIECKNTSGSTITKGTPVYQTGNVGATAVIEIAEADALISANKGPAIGLLQDTLTNNAFGFVVIIGELLNFTTSPIDGVTPTVGDKIFVKSGGGLTTVKPTTSLNSIQAIGLIGKVSGGNAGSVTVSSTMRANDVPNLPEGRIWIGDGNTIVSDTVYVDEPNNRVGIGTTSPLGAIQIGDGAAASPSTNQILVLSNTATTGGNSNLYLATGASGTSTIGMGGTQFSVTNTAGKITYTDSSDTFSFNTNFSTKMVINGSGNVGIGTTSPSEKLDVRSGSFNSSVAQFTGANDGRGLLISTFSRASNDDSVDYNAQYSGLGVQTWSINSSEKMRLNQSGNVGIGTTSPTVELQVGNFGGTETPEIIVAGGTSSQIQLRTTNATGSFAQVGFGGSQFANSNTAGKIKYTHTSQTSPWLDVMSFRVNYSDRMIINGSGNVGIGTTSPGEKLEVDGNVKADNYINQRVAWNVGFNHGSNNAASYYYIPVGYLAETTADTYYNNWIAPYAGRVRKIVMRNTGTSTAPTATTINFRISVNGTVTYTGGTFTVTGSGLNQIATHEFIPGSSGSPFFNATDRVQVAFRTNGFWRNAATGISLEYTE